MPEIFVGMILVSLSAMVFWAATVHGNGFRHSPVRHIRLLNGEADSVVSALALDVFRGSEIAHHTFDRQASGTQSGFRSVRRGMRKLTQRVLSSEVTRPPLQILPEWGTSDRLKDLAGSGVIARAHGHEFGNHGG